MAAERVTSSSTPLTDEEVAAALDLADEQDSGPDVTPDIAPSRPKRARTPRARKSSPAKPRADRAPRAPSRPRTVPLGRRVADAHTTVALGLGMLPAPWAMPTAQALATQADAIGKAWQGVAAENPRVAEALERILTVSTVGALLGAYIPVVMAGVMASGKMPAGLLDMTGGGEQQAPAAA